jgi:hypothetical protein
MYLVGHNFRLATPGRSSTPRMCSNYRSIITVDNTNFNTILHTSYQGTMYIHHHQGHSRHVRAPDENICCFLVCSDEQRGRIRHVLRALSGQVVVEITATPRIDDTTMRRDDQTTTRRHHTTKSRQQNDTTIRGHDDAPTRPHDHQTI